MFLGILQLAGEKVTISCLVLQSDNPTVAQVFRLRREVSLRSTLIVLWYLQQRKRQSKASTGYKCAWFELAWGQCICC